MSKSGYHVTMIIVHMMEYAKPKRPILNQKSWRNYVAHAFTDELIDASITSCLAVRVEG